MKYKELIQLSKEGQASEEAAYKAEQADLQLQADLSATKQSLVEAKRSLTNSKKASPFNATEVIQAQIKVEQLEEGLKRLEELRTELF